MKELTKKQVDEIKKVGIFTGSRCFNSLVNEDSDYDFVLLKKDADRIIPELKEKSKNKDVNNIWEQYHEKQYEGDETVFVSLKFEYKTSDQEFLINLIIVDSQVLYDAWKFTTNCFKSNFGLLDKYFPEDGKDKLKTKEIKKLFFEDIKLAFVKSNHILNDITNPKLDSSKLKGLRPA